MPPLKDLTGLKFNRLTVIERDNTRTNGVYWICLCECGKRVSVKAYNLTSGETKSCGCLNNENIRRKQRNSADLAGQTIGNFEVIRYVGSNKLGTLWECKCLLCEKIKVIPAAWIKQNKSCGCLANKTKSENVKRYQDKLSDIKSNVSILREAPNRNNTTGVRGVCYIKSKKMYLAYISYQNKSYILLRSTDINQCIAARKAAEKAVREDFLKWYNAEYKKDE